MASSNERPGPRLRDYVRAVKACFGAFRTGQLDHHGEFYELDFITPQMCRIRKWMWRQ
jgi:alkanesulfonate monooxygenase SsuD/methylene tetrahydromethanopterin reductase-like flavin-dependent oxidoreductase (luciferase family)